MTDIDTITDAADYRTAAVRQVIGALADSVVVLNDAQEGLRAEVAELAAQDLGTTSSMVADYVQAHPPAEFYAHEQRQVPLTRAGNAELAPEHYRDRAAEDAAEQDAAPLVQDIVVGYAGMLDTRKLGRPAAQPYQPSAQLSERLFDEPARLTLTAEQAEAETVRLAATRDKQQSKHYVEHDCADEDDPSDQDQPAKGHDVHAKVAAIIERAGKEHGMGGLFYDSSHHNTAPGSKVTRPGPESEWGQRGRGPWSSYSSSR